VLSGAPSVARESAADFLLCSYEQRYDVRELDEECGFTAREKVGLDVHGGFFLWEADESPLVSYLV
jgi:hypothetical protein